MDWPSEAELAKRYWKDPAYQRADAVGPQSVEVRVPEDWVLDFESLGRARALNEIYRYERSAQGALIVSLRAAGWWEAGLIDGVRFALYQYCHDDDERYANGLPLGPKVMCDWPDGSILSPSIGWIPPHLLPARTSRSWMDEIDANPTFVAEHHIANDSIGRLREKMERYLDLGVELGWLLSWSTRRAYVYRAGRACETLEAPVSLNGGDVLPGFEADLADAWPDEPISDDTWGWPPRRADGGFLVRVRLPETWHLPLPLVHRISEMNPQYRIDRTLNGDLIVAGPYSDRAA